MFPRETHALLVSMCGATVNLNDINLELSTLPPGIPSDLSGWNKFRNLISLRGQLATQVAMIGTKLRILPKSRDVRRLRTTETYICSEPSVVNLSMSCGCMSGAGLTSTQSLSSAYKRPAV